MVVTILHRIHNPTGRRCGCRGDCWCQQTLWGRALRWYAPKRYHRPVSPQSKRRKAQRLR